MRILTEHGGRLSGLLPARASIVEFGSGASRKFRALLAAKPDIAAYIPVDISAEFLEEETRTLRVDFPFLSVLPVATDFTRPFDLPRQAYWGPRVGFFPGSTIGNFEPGEAAAFLTHARMVLGPRSLMIVGVDLIKDKARLEAAYDDAAGVTAAFNLNLLSRINRELDGTFEPAGFRHVAFYDEAAQRIEMHLESVRSQLVHVGTAPFAFAEGDRIHTENSYKYSVEGFQALAGQAGWAPVAVLSDPDRLFSMHVLKAQA
jgi:dimethylhistidine N-methyltransferase